MVVDLIALLGSGGKLLFKHCDDVLGSRSALSVIVEREVDVDDVGVGIEELHQRVRAQASEGESVRGVVVLRIIGKRCMGEGVDGALEYPHRFAVPVRDHEGVRLIASDRVVLAVAGYRTGAGIPCDAVLVLANEYHGGRTLAGFKLAVLILNPEHIGLVDGALVDALLDLAGVDSAALEVLIDSVVVGGAGSGSFSSFAALISTGLDSGFSGALSPISAGSPTSSRMASTKDLPSYSVRKFSVLPPLP